MNIRQIAAIIKSRIVHWDVGMRKRKHKTDEVRALPVGRLALVAIMIAVLVVPLGWSLFFGAYPRSMMVDLLVIGIMICLAIYIAYQLLLRALGVEDDEFYYADEFEEDLPIAGG